jgi:hypothetical protein
MRLKRIFDLAQSNARKVRPIMSQTAAHLQRNMPDLLRIQAPHAELSAPARPEGHVLAFGDERDLLIAE